MKLLTKNDDPAIAPPPELALVGEHVRLSPLRERHAAAIQLWFDEAPNEFTAGLSSPLDHDNSALRFVQWLLDLKEKGAVLPFVVESPEGDFIGYTRYTLIEPWRRVIHIGGTWYAPPFRGTKVNPEAKFLLLENAFEQYGFNRVEIHTDTINVRSQRAITRIGATFEGISRADYLRRDGSVRDTWIASIIRSEWPDVRDRLQQLIAEA